MRLNYKQGILFKLTYLSLFNNYISISIFIIIFGLYNIVLYILAAALFRGKLGQQK